jgi:site-specific DNA-methyltransferase (cytosine-N4-specific)
MAILKRSYNPKKNTIRHKTDLGAFYNCSAEELLPFLCSEYKEKVQLILTSPPFALNHKKKYGNYKGSQYVDWLVKFAPFWSNLLKPDGSIVIEIGNAWEPGRPVQSILTYEALLGIVKHPDADFRLCQEFICHNPARLPSPAQWVNVKRNRVKDSFTHVWWIAKSDEPKADNRKVLRPYSQSMRELLGRGNYNSGRRPSGHRIGETSFLKKHEGSIMPAVIEIDSIGKETDLRLPFNCFSIANTRSTDFFHNECKMKNLKPHPALMPLTLADFFIHFLTDPGDLVLDPFAGSNTTGFCAERRGRKWISIEIKKEYVIQSKIRFSELKKKSGTKGANR